MVVQELKNDVSTIRIHDEFCESDFTRLIGSVSRVISDSYKRRYLSKSQEQPSVVVSTSENQPITTALQA